MVLLRAVLAFALLIALSTWALAEDEKPVGFEEAKQFFPDWSYPGWMSGHTGFTDLAFAQVMSGVQSYSRVYGHLPTSWAEVVNAQIWQTPLIGLNFEQIDPDDGRLDFFGDVLYSPLSNPPSLMTLSYFGERKLSTQGQQVTVLPSYASEFGKVGEAYVPEVAAMLGNDKLLRQFAILRGIQHSLNLYTVIHGHQPVTLAEFLASGLGPINEHSINPVTGLPFKGDGSANDILYKSYVGQSNAVGLFHVDSTGKTPNKTFNY
jgi:hypothetical protein